MTKPALYFDLYCIRSEITSYKYIIYIFVVVVQNAEMKFNFGDSPFKYPPGGYEGVSKASNLVPYSGSAPAVAHGGPKKGSGRKTPMAIIIEPARELAQQTHDNITLFKKHLSSPGVR